MSLLAQIDLNRALGSEEYTAALDRWQPALSQLVRQAHAARRPLVIVFEGWDAADRVAVIKRLTERLDSRGYMVHASAAPAGEDATHHYLYRFWRRLPPRGRIAIFDGSWYGRVLAERVEGHGDAATWRRAYREINQFERQLVDFGTIVLKFWLHISSEEQARRFSALIEAPQSNGGPVPEPYLDPDKRSAYEVAAEEMLLKTSAIIAPWTIVEAHDRSWACIRVLRTAVKRLGAELSSSNEGTEAESGAAAQPAPDDADDSLKAKGQSAVVNHERGKAKGRKD